MSSSPPRWLVPPRWAIARASLQENATATVVTVRVLRVTDTFSPGRLALVSALSVLLCQKSKTVHTEGRHARRPHLARIDAESEEEEEDWCTRPFGFAQRSCLSDSSFATTLPEEREDRIRPISPARGSSQGTSQSASHWAVTLAWGVTVAEQGAESAGWELGHSQTQ